MTGRIGAELRRGVREVLAVGVTALDHDPTTDPILVAEGVRGALTALLTAAYQDQDQAPSPASPPVK